MGAQAQPSRQSSDALSASTPNPLIRNLARLYGLDEDERSALAEATAKAEWVEAGSVVVAEGHIEDATLVLISGWALRCKDLSDGRRQIIAVLAPGDILIHCAESERRADHAVQTLTRARIAWISRAAITALEAAFPGVAAAFRNAALIEAATLRAWLIGLGQRNARERMAHLFCELAARLTEAGAADARTVETPLTQLELGYALGLTTVHVNRTLQQLRSAALVEFRNGVITIPDLPRLEAVAGFEGSYLTV